MKATSLKRKTENQKLIKLLVFLFFSLLHQHGFCQHKNAPLNREWALDLEKKHNAIYTFSANAIVHDSIVNKVELADSILPLPIIFTAFKPIIISAIPIKKDTTKSLVFRKIKKESLVSISDSSDKFILTIDPLFNFEFGRDYADSSKSFYKNTRGALVRGNIGNQFSFESSFYENQATFVNYLKKFNDAYLIIPGQGRWKKFKDTGYDFAMASGYVMYTPSKHFNFQIGHGKHFIGDGYRSLLLSDNAFNYPFARLTTTFGKIQYTNLYASFMNLSYGGVTTPKGTERLFQKKAASFQYLNWNAHSSIQLGLFQGLIWKASDSLNKQCIKLPFASPLIYTAAISEGLTGNNNILLGATFKLKFTNTFYVYGQYMLDDFGAGFNTYKSGLQLGLKYFDVFGLKNLHMQLEGNSVHPYSYAATNATQSYTHYNQALAHPLGSNFSEAIIILNYKVGDFFTQAKFNFATTGFDELGLNYGNNIFYSDTLNVPNSQTGDSRSLRIIDMHIGYLVNPATNLNIFVGISNRSSISPIENSQTNFVYFGIRTSLQNIYYDF